MPKLDIQRLSIVKLLALRQKYERTAETFMRKVREIDAETVRRFKEKERDGNPDT